MCRIIAALLLPLASTATASAQGLSPSVWQAQRGALLKVLRVDAAGNFSESSSAAQPVPVQEVFIIWYEAFEALGWSSERRGTGHRIAM